MSLRRTHASPRCTLVLPVYNAGPGLEPSLRATGSWLDGRDEGWELILVDDGSSDVSARILDRFMEDHAAAEVRLVRFGVNRGKGFAVRVGLHKARGELVLFTDCDLAYPLANLDRLLARLDDGADAAIACRVAPESTYVIRPSFFSYLFTRHVMGRAFSRLCNAITVPRLRDTQAGLKGFRTAAVQPLLARLRLDGFSFDVELLRALLDRGARIDEVPVEFRYDNEPSTLDFTRDAIRMVRDLLRVRRWSKRGLYTRALEPKRVIIHADDYGLAPGVNRAIEEGLSKGAVHSASILVGGGDGLRALAWAAAHPECDFGVHLNLTHGRPVSDPAGVRSLVDASGRFHGLTRLLGRLLLDRVVLSEVESEWRAQIAAVRDAGVRVSHLDSHRHVHLVPSLFRGVAAPLAAELGVTLRAMDGPFGAGHPSLKMLALVLATRVSVGRRFRHLVVAHGSGAALSTRATLEDLREFFSRVRPGETIELVVHPGFPDAALSASGDRYREGRQREHDLLVSEEARAWIGLSGISLCDFRAVRPR
jgi:dolichyl-phosphate beta-glucosyltransferase